MADNTGSDPSNRQVQQNVNRNTNKRVQSIKKLVQGVPPGVEGPHNPDGSYDRNVATNNVTASKQTSLLKNQQKQQISVFQLLAQSVAKIEKMLTDIFNRQKEDKLAQDDQYKKLNENVEKLIDQFSPLLNTKLAQALSSLTNTLGTFNQELTSGIKVTLSDSSINQLNTKLSTTLTPTIKDIDLTPLINEKLKEIDLNTTISSKIKNNIDLTSLISGKLKEIDLNTSLNEKIILDKSSLTKTINNQLTGLFSNIELSTIIENKVKPIKIDVNDKINSEALNQSLSKAISKIKFDNIDLTEAISKKVKTTTLNLNDKINVKDVTIKVTKAESGSEESKSKFDFGSFNTLFLNINNFLSGINEKLLILVPSLPEKEAVSGEEDSDKKPNLISLINDLTKKTYESLTNTLTGISSDIIAINDSLNNAFKDGDKNKIDILNSTLSSFSKNIDEAIKDITNKIQTAIANYFDKTDTIFYKNIKDKIDDSLNKKLESILSPSPSKQNLYTYNSDIKNVDRPISIEGNLGNENKDKKIINALKKVEINKPLAVTNLTLLSNIQNKTEPQINKKLKYEYINDESNIIKNISDTIELINKKLDNIYINQNKILDKNISIENKKENLDIGNIITQPGENWNLRSNVSDVFKIAGRNILNKIKYNRFVDFLKLASNFKKPIKVLNKIQDKKSFVASINKMTNKKDNFSWISDKKKDNGVLSVVGNLVSGNKKEEKQPYSLENYLTSFGKYATLLEVITGKIGKGIKNLNNSIFSLNLGAGEGKSLSVDGLKDLIGGKGPGGIDVSQIADKLGGKDINITQIADKIGDATELLKGTKGLGKVGKGLGSVGKTASGAAKVGSVLGSAGTIVGGALVAGTAAAAAHGIKNASKWDDQIGNTTGESLLGTKTDGAFAGINHYLGEGAIARAKTAWRTGKWSKLWGANNLLDNEYTEAEHKALISLGKEKADELKFNRQTEIIQNRLNDYNKGNIYAEYGNRMNIQNSIITKTIDKAVGVQDSSLVGNTVSLNHLNTQQLSNLSQAAKQRGALIKFQSLTTNKAATDLMGDDFVKRMSDAAGKDVSSTDRAKFSTIHEKLTTKARVYTGKNENGPLYKLPYSFQQNLLIKAGMDGELGPEKINYLNSLSEELLENGVETIKKEQQILLQQDDTFNDAISEILKSENVNNVSNKDINNYKKNILAPFNWQMLRHFQSILDLKKQERQNNILRNVADATLANKKQQAEKEQLTDENINIEMTPISSQTASNAVEQSVKSSTSTSSEAPLQKLSPEYKLTFNPTLPQKLQQGTGVQSVTIVQTLSNRAIGSENS